ncbi:hypothetical protein DRQ53_15865, partial [bacterium]
MADGLSGLQIISSPTTNLNQQYDYCVYAYRDTTLSESACDGGISPSATSELKLTELLEQLQASGVSTGSDYGFSVSLWENRAIVGYPDDGPNDQGSAFIFEFDEGAWRLRQKITASDGEEQDSFGYSVSISGDQAIVGAPFKGAEWTPDYAKGAAYVFERGASGWSATETKKITPAVTASNDYFGWSVAIDGNRAIVGAKESEFGSAYVFERGATSWPATETKKITPDDRNSNDEFGTSVSISGDVAIVGDPEYGGISFSEGAAYVFERGAAGWPATETQLIVASEGAHSDGMGSGVSIDGDFAVIGAPGADAGGRAYIIDRTSGSWSTAETILQPEEWAASIEFGTSVAISGSRVLIGAPSDDVGGILNAGSAFLFQLEEDESWSQTQKFSPADKTSSTGFGTSVSISGDRSLFGYGGFVAALTRGPGAVTASDGTHNSQVRITWEDRSGSENGFRIFRNNQPIAEVPSNTIVYEDFYAVPGQTYEYSVAAFTGDLETNRVSDFGWRPANGNLTGRISTIAGAGADSVQVVVTPLPTKALLFDGNGGHVSVSDDAGAFDFDSDTSFTLETWVKYPEFGGTGSADGVILAKSAPGSGSPRFPFALGTTGEPGRLKFALSDGASVDSVITDRNDLNDNQWHH